MLFQGFVKSEDYVDYQLWLNSNPVYPPGLGSVEAYYKFGKKDSTGLKVQRCIDEFG